MSIRIDHIAIWVKDLENMRSFYQTYFDLKASSRYHNPVKGFRSYFLHDQNGNRIELMSREDIQVSKQDQATLGFAHLAFSLGSRSLVDKRTQQIRNDNYSILGEARVTGDGYYESVIADPEGNIIEICE